MVMNAALRAVKLVFKGEGVQWRMHRVVEVANGARLVRAKGNDAGLYNR